MSRVATPSRALTYKDSGVDIEAGDAVVDRIKKIVRRTHNSRVLGRHGDFAGMFRLDFSERLFRRNYKDPVLVACTDGVGTKVLIAAERGVYDTVGIDCVAMNVNDLIVCGAEPLFFLDYLGLSRVHPDETTAMIEGVAKGCELAGCALIGGECAEMPDVYKPGDFDIAGFCVGIVEMKRALDASWVRRGDVILGLASSGIHSNGYSLVRRIVKDAGLDMDKRYAELGREPLWKVLLEPTRIYAKQVGKVLAAYHRKRPISAMAHITGGGLPGNVCRGLPDTLDAVIDCTSWEPHPIFPFLQRHGGVATDEMFRVFNMGIGYTMFVRPEHATAVRGRLRRMGEKVWRIGTVEKGSGEVRLTGLDSAEG